jgi:hypothetical protein
MVRCDRHEQRSPHLSFNLVLWKQNMCYKLHLDGPPVKESQRRHSLCWPGGILDGIEAKWFDVSLFVD